MAYVKRTIEAHILEAARSMPCIVVYGPRQVGKSTTVDRLFGYEFRKVNLDDLSDRAAANDDPRGFLEAYGWPLVIDEIQKAPALLDAIKASIDAQRLEWMREGGERSLMYVLTGSNRFELQEGVSESLAGRCAVVEMSSFSQAESRGFGGALFDPDPRALLDREREIGDAYLDRGAIFDLIFTGGMPDVVTGVSERSIYFRSYVATYIEKDVRKLIAADKEGQFSDFLRIVALRTAQEVRYDDIAGSVGIDARTCKGWLSILEMSGIVFMLRPYMANASSRIIKAPKLYFSDTGLCSYLCGWQDARMLGDGAMGGAFFETFVASELVKNLTAHGLDPKESLYYYRDTDKREVDFVFSSGGALHPIEAKASAFPKNPTRHFGALGRYKMPVGSGLVIDTCPKMLPIGDGAYSYPVSILGL